MLSDKEIRALMDGAYGITRNGVQVKYMGKTKGCKYGWAKYRDWYLDDIDFNYVDFCSYLVSKESPLDIVGLWEDRVEPFNLERALAGEMITEKGVKYWLNGQLKSNEDYYILEDEIGGITKCFIGELNSQFTMYKEPEPVKPSADALPKPIREIDNLVEVWVIEKCVDVYRPKLVSKGINWVDWQITAAKKGCYYATKEDCQAVCDWLMNR